MPIMKRRILIYILSILSILLVVPAINIVNAPSRDVIRLQEKSFLYNMDFVSRWTAELLYPFGISINPKQVIIGKDSWLYLGDDYEQTISTDRRSASESDIIIGKQIRDATEAWNSYLMHKGVKVFQIMIGPNKGSIYPEYMPSWAKPAVYNPTDALLAETGGEHYIDLKTPLLAAKDKNPIPLYYKTDTHWNELGASVAFRALGQKVGKLAPELKWPLEEEYQLTQVTTRNGGDLANFLRLSTNLHDETPVIYASSLPVKTIQTDFATKKVLFQGGNPEVLAPVDPLLVTSLGALNDKKVLWLRDSFGTALSPLMAETFKEVLQVHWGRVTKPEGLAQLVNEWKPDFVFVTVVERDARSPWFSTFPQLEPVLKSEDFKTVSTTVPVYKADLVQSPLDNEYQITGNDSQIGFALSNPVTRLDAQYLNIGLTCSDNTSSIPLQLFWLEGGMQQYDEDHSVRLLFHTGEYLIDLRQIQKLNSLSELKQIRVDIDAVSSCSNFKLYNPRFGRLSE